MLYYRTSDNCWWHRNKTTVSSFEAFHVKIKQGMGGTLNFIWMGGTLNFIWMGGTLNFIWMSGTLKFICLFVCSQI